MSAWIGPAAANLTPLRAFGSAILGPNSAAALQRPHPPQFIGPLAARKFPGNQMRHPDEVNELNPGQKLLVAIWVALFGYMSLMFMMAG
jgi:hypothetical protein